VDLGGIKTITKVVIDWTSAYAIQYRIEVSDDGVNYTTALDRTDNTSAGITTDELLAVGRYVRIYMVSSSGAWASIDECKVYGYHGLLPSPGPTPTPTPMPTPSESPTPTPTPTPTPPPGEPVLISLNKPASASQSQGGFPPKNANDGSNSTRWAAGVSTFPQWWAVDLESVYTINQVTIRWYSSHATHYLIQVSDDGVNYTTVVDKSDNTQTGTTTDTFSATGRYVRIYMPSSAGAWASIVECSVYTFYP